MGNLSITLLSRAPATRYTLNLRLRYASPREYNLLQLAYRSLRMERTALQNDAGLTFDEPCNFFVWLEFFSIYPRRCCILPRTHNDSAARELFTAASV
jgi:hypothetical protein